jgi:hypothetical protein
VPAEDLDAFNAHIVGPIELIATYPETEENGRDRRETLFRELLLVRSSYASMIASKSSDKPKGASPSSTTFLVAGSIARA